MKHFFLLVLQNPRFWVSSSQGIATVTCYHHPEDIHLYVVLISMHRWPLSAFFCTCSSENSGGPGDVSHAHISCQCIPPVLAVTDESMGGCPGSWDPTYYMMPVLGPRSKTESAIHISQAHRLKVTQSDTQHIPCSSSPVFLDRSKCLYFCTRIQAL